MNYESAAEKLRAGHLYPVVHREIGNGNKAIGLEVKCNSFTMERRKELVLDILGSGWKVEWMPNHLYLLVTKK